MTVVVERTGAIGTITLDHPPVNALSRDVMDAMAEALENLQPPDTRVLVLRARPGSDVFSAGHDVHELPTNGRDPLTYNDPLRRVVRDIETHPAPVIAMVEGSVWGGACELVMSCDLIVAADDSTFALTPARLGVPYNLAGTLNLMKVADMHIVKEMLFTSQPIPAIRMASFGVINAAVPRGSLEAATMEFASRVASTSPLVLRILKEELRVLANAHPMTPEAFERIQALRRQVYDSEDYQEGIRAFIEKRLPIFTGR